MKRIRGMLCVCAVCLLCVCMCGCEAEEWLELSVPTTQTTTEPTIATTTTAPGVEVPITLLGNGYAYTVLDEKQQDNYEFVVRSLYDMRGQDTMVEEKRGLSVALPHALRSEEELKQLFTAVYDDHPEFFYLSGQYGGTSIGSFYTTLRVYYIWDARERAAKAIELEAAVSSLTTEAQGMTALEQELFFHDTLIERCEYNEIAAEESENDNPSVVYYEASSAYAGLCSHAPICGGYSRAFQLLLSRVGIPSTLVVNDDHVWSMVWLDDTAYHVDVTWDDPTEGIEHHDYFNITDEETEASREYPEQPRAVAQATATAHNYYVQNDWYFEDAFDEMLDDCIRAQIESGKDVVELKFTPDAFIDAGSRLFDDEGFFEAVYELEDDALRDRWYSAILYEENEELYTIRIYVDEGT